MFDLIVCGMNRHGSAFVNSGAIMPFRESRSPTRYLWWLSILNTHHHSPNFTVSFVMNILMHDPATHDLTKPNNISARSACVQYMLKQCIIMSSQCDLLHCHVAHSAHMRAAINNLYCALEILSLSYGRTH